MTNANVGVVYQQIIRDVVESSRIDFEEGGVEEGVLEELSRGWQMKLSQLGVAQFPWDPKPEPPQTPLVNTAPPSNGINYQPNVDTPPMSQPQPSLSLPPLPPMPQQINNGPRIKTEPGLENGANQAPPSFNGLNMPNATTAQQRAAQNLQASYGARAAASINAIHGLPQQGQPQGQQQIPAPQQQLPQGQIPQAQQQRPPNPQAGKPQLTPAQYQQAMAQQAAAQRQQLQNQAQNGVSNAQTDGAGDDDLSFGIAKRFDAQGNEIEIGRVEIDNMIRKRIEAMGQTMEGGGLMLPLHRQKVAAGSRKRKHVDNGEGSSSSALPPAPQFDGGDDDDDDDVGGNLKAEEVDDDAINSDLDDPSDNGNDSDDEDDGMGHIMLCMYDKVQRVKNKWKCVMKDGVLTVNGKEYVFHKASGEYEW